MKTQGESNHWKCLYWDCMTHCTVSDQRWVHFRHLYNNCTPENVTSVTEVHVKCQNMWRTVNLVKYLPWSRPPFISVSTDSYISMLDLLCRIIFADCFLFAKAGQPQLTNQNAGSAQREAGNLRKQTPAVNQKWFQRDDHRWCDQRVLLQILCPPGDSHISQAAVNTPLK